jgi:hypothetical protein
MKAILYFIISCFISTGALLGGLNLANPFPNYAVAFGIWALFLWSCSSRGKKRAEKHFREKMFEDYMRANIRNNRHY